MSNLILIAIKIRIDLLEEKKTLSETRKCQSINFCMTRVLMLKWVVGLPYTKSHEKYHIPNYFVHL